VTRSLLSTRETLWTQDLAEGLKDKAAALEASIFAFKSKPSLTGYRAIESLSGNLWPVTKEQLLQQIRRMSAWREAEAQIDILLHEKLIEDAVKKVSGFSFREALIWRVMDDAIASHSQWIIDKTMLEAQKIVEAGKAKYYNTAIEWLKRATAAYLAQGKQQDWQQYRQELTNVHGRKRKLMELLRQNGL